MNTCNQLLHIRLVISHELIYLILCVWMFWLYVHLCTTYVPSVQVGQGTPKQVRELDPMQLEPQLVVS